VILPPVIVPPVTVVINDVAAVRSVAKNVLEVAFTKVDVVAKSEEVIALVLKSDVSVAEEAKKLVLVLLAKTARVEKISVEEASVAKSVLTVVVPEVRVVKVGVSDTAIVEVPVILMLLPAMRYVAGELKKLCQAVVDAVRGIENPAAEARVKV
jgi:hypothetical protein